VYFVLVPVLVNRDSFLVIGFFGIWILNFDILTFRLHPSYLFILNS